MEIIIRTAVVYFLLLFILRITTRRLMRSATPLDLAIVFLFGGISLQAITGMDHSIISSLLSIGTIALLHVVISMLKWHWPAFSNLVEGTPVIIYHDGQWNEKRMKDLRVQHQDVRAEMRQRGLRNLEQVDFVTVEHNGAITIIQKEAQSFWRRNSKIR